MKFLKLKLLVFALMIFVASPAFASLSYEVTVNTSSIAGDSGYLYFQYTPVNAAASTATLSGFTTDGVLGAQDTVDVVNGSAVSGTLPGSVVFANTNGVNDYNHAMTTFGNTISFDVLLSTPASGGPSYGSTTFSLGIFADAFGNTPLLNVNGGNYAGTLFTISLNNDGTGEYQTMADTNVTPIPASVLLFAPGLLGLVGLRRRA
jgi:hypothetical protein